MGCVASTSIGATISQGDVTSNLGGTIFFDNARTGGGDATANEGQTITVNRFLDYDGNGIIAAPGEEGLLEINTFGFATSAAATANDASEVDITILYYGQDEVLNGGDDVSLGTQRVSYNHTTGGEYFVDFDTPFTATINGLGNRYRIQVSPVDNDGGIVESIRMKTRPASEQTFGHQGPSMSLSGSFTPTAVPEPSSLMMLTLLSALSLTAKRS